MSRGDELELRHNAGRCLHQTRVREECGGAREREGETSPVLACTGPQGSKTPANDQFNGAGRGEEGDGMERGGGGGGKMRRDRQGEL